MCCERQYDKQCCHLKTEWKVNSSNQKTFSPWLATLRRVQGSCTSEMVAKPAMEMRNPSIRVEKVILNSFASSEFFHLAWIWGEHLGNFDLISQAITSKWEFSLLEESADFLGEVKSCPPSLTLWNEHPWLLVLCSQASRSPPPPTTPPGEVSLNGDARIPNSPLQTQAVPNKPKTPKKEMSNYSKKKVNLHFSP